MSTEPDYWPVVVADKLRIIRRYPDRWGDINDLFESSDDFRLLCHEYVLATDALSRLNRISDTQAVSRREEYADIVLELESELLKYVDEHAS